MTSRHAVRILMIGDFEITVGYYNIYARCKIPKLKKHKNNDQINFEGLLKEIGGGNDGQ